MKITIDPSKLCNGVLADGDGHYCAIGLVLHELGVPDSSMVGVELPSRIVTAGLDEALLHKMGELHLMNDKLVRAVTMASDDYTKDVDEDDDSCPCCDGESFGGIDAIVTALLALGVEAEVLA